MYKIEERVLTATLQYLATRPYQEVADLIMILRNLQKVEPKKENDDTKESNRVSEEDSKAKR